MGQSPLISSSRQRLTNISCFIIWVGALGIQTALLWWFDYELESAINDSLISATVLAGACYLISSALHHYVPSRRHYLHVIIGALLLAIISLVVSHWLLKFFLVDRPAYLQAADQSLPLRFWFNTLMIAWVATINILWDLQLDRKENEQRKADAERLAREAELYNLRQQLQPHFLFNSLNSIIALIAKQPIKAREMAFQLSTFLRGTLRDDDQQLITLREELAHLALYLDIEKVRFGHRLETKIIVEDVAESAHLPPMILQPLLENAIKFGLHDTTGPVRVEVHATLNEDRQLEVWISNPFKSTIDSQHKGTGFGLRGVRRRLFLLFGRTDLLDTQTESSVFTSIIRLPQ